MTKLPVYPMFIGGEHRAAASGKTCEVENPATGEVIAMAAEGDETDIDRAVAVASDSFAGWMGPGLTETFETPDLMVAEGIEYIADWVHDDQPCELRTTAGPLYTVPYTVELNDIPMMLLQHHRASELFERTMDQFDRLYAEGADGARVMAIAVHPYITGAPHRIKYYENLLESLKERPDVLFWAGEQILDWYKCAKDGG